MAITANDVQTLHDYAEGVLGRAEHHAGQVAAIALALLGAIVWRGEPGSIEIKQYAGNLANVLWVTIAGTRYAFSYNHETEEIEMRDRTTHGEVRHRFSNATPATEVERIFRALV
jgi:Integron cassette protein VCH_CASS1 chain